jgi:GNAT superfamily N-acetyltransferase
MSDISIESFRGTRETMTTIAILHLQVRRWQIAQGYARFVNSLYNSQADLNDIDNYYIKPGGNFWVARVTDGDVGIIGFVGLKREQEDKARLKRLAVLPTFQGRGVGTRLVQSAIDYASSSGIQEIHLATGRQETARPLYDKLGFVEVGVDEPNNDYLMMLEVPELSVT